MLTDIGAAARWSTPLLFVCAPAAMADFLEIIVDGELGGPEPFRNRFGATAQHDRPRSCIAATAATFSCFDKRAAGALNGCSARSIILETSSSKVA